MYRIFEFIYRYRAFLSFFLIEVLCIWMIVSFNAYQGAAFFNTSNYYVAGALSLEQNISSYFRLNKVNEELAAQNARLLNQLNQIPRHDVPFADTLRDTTIRRQYSYLPARVVKNTTRLPENFLTLDKGTSDGIEPDMGVIGPDGLVGRVKTVSRHFCTVVSMLHSGMNVASRIKKGNIDATVVWDGLDPREGKVLHVVRHHKIAEGDSVVTSEYNAVFPEGVLIGTIGEYSLGEGSSDYDIQLNFSTDFSALSYVYIIQNHLRVERDSLENTIK